MLGERPASLKRFSKNGVISISKWELSLGVFFL